MATRAIWATSGNRCRRTLRTALCGLLALSLVACTSMQVIEPARSQDIVNSVHVGDEVRATLTNAKQYRFKIVELRKDAIVGRINDKNYTFPFAQIEKIEVERVSAVKTAGLVGLSLVVLYLVLLAAGAFAFSQAVKN